MARGPAAVHTIEYNPELAAQPDYYVAEQCGQVLRFFAPPAAERRDLAFAERGVAVVRELVQGELSRLRGVTPDAAAGFATQFYNGLMRQLRSMPVELRVAEWIQEAYPELGFPQQSPRMLHACPGSPDQ